MLAGDRRLRALVPDLVPAPDRRSAVSALYRVRIRRQGFPAVKPDAEMVDGWVHGFSEGWEIDPEDSSIYEGEIAMIPDREEWPLMAPVWIASGDLELFDPATMVRTYPGPRKPTLRFLGGPVHGKVNPDPGPQVRWVQVPVIGDRGIEPVTYERSGDLLLYIGRRA